MSIAKKAAPPHARVSVIIPARNARQSIGETLGSLVSETPLIEEILVIDDSSTDGTASFAEAERKRLGLPVRVLQAGARGTGATRNADGKRERIERPAGYSSKAANARGII